MSPCHQQDFVLRHPGLDTSCNILVRIPCLEELHDHVAGWGIDRQLCRSIGIIICGPGSPTHLSKLLSVLVNDPAIEEEPTEDIIPAGDYWFYPGGWTKSQGAFPITTRFEDWEFPHGNVPTNWNVFLGQEHGHSFHSGTYQERVRRRDGMCKVTGWSEGGGVAHIVPQAAKYATWV